MEQQTQQTHSQSWKVQCSVLYFVGFVMLGAVISGLGPFIPFKAANSGLVETAFGIVFTFRGVGYVLGSMSIGRFEEKFAAHKMMSCSFLIIAITCFLAVSTEAVIPMGIIFFFSSLGLSGIDVLSQASIVEVHGDKVDPWMQFLHFCFGLGSFISPLCLAWLGEQAYSLFGMMSLIMVVVFFLFDSPKIHKNKEGVNKQQNFAPLPDQLSTLLSIFFFIYVGAETGYGGWISTYGTLSQIATTSEAAYCSSIFWGFLSIGRILAVPFAVRYPTNVQLRTLILGCIGSMLFCILMIVLSTPRTAIFFGSALYGLFISAIYPLLMSMPGFLKYKLSAKNTSVYVVAGACGQSLIPVLIGYGISWTGPNTLYGSSLVINFMFCFLFLKIMTFQKQSLENIGMPLMSKRDTNL